MKCTCKYCEEWSAIREGELVDQQRSRALGSVGRPQRWATLLLCVGLVAVLSGCGARIPGNSLAAGTVGAGGTAFSGGGATSSGGGGGGTPSSGGATSSGGGTPSSGGATSSGGGTPSSGGGTGGINI
ncbi:MAG: hypothetical protein ACYCV7_06895, partial [Acidimicrobiales bacterium]